MSGCIAVAVAKQHHIHPVTPKPFYCINFQGGGSSGHHNGGRAAHPGGRECNALRMVAGRGSNHATFQLHGAEVGHFVVSTAQLEAEHLLHVLTLEQHLIGSANRQGMCALQWCLNGHVVNLGGQYAF